MFCASFSVGDITLSFICLELRDNDRCLWQRHCALPQEITQDGRVISLSTPCWIALGAPSSPGILGTPVCYIFGPPGTLTRPPCSGHQYPLRRENTTRRLQR